MGILESLLNGSDGLVSKAFQFFGTNATLCYLKESQSSNENDDGPDYSTLDVSFIPEKITESDLTRENGLGVKRSILSGMICASDIERMPIVHKDGILYRDIHYRITEVNQELIGNSGTILLIKAIR